MKKGFTLIEVIAVIFILGILSSIAGVTYTTISNNHKKKSCENLKMQIENAAIEYVQDGHKLPRKVVQNEASSVCGCTTRDPYCICIYYNSKTTVANDLLVSGYLEGDLENPVDGKSLSVKIKVEYDKDKDIYKANIIEDFCNK